MNQILNEDVLKKIYKRIPKKIRKMLVAFNDGEYLRLPTEKEIFGVNECGEEEGADVEQFEYMKKIKHRIAFQGYKTDKWEWYWLANRHKSSAGIFAVVSDSGNSSYNFASSSGGVRPTFLLRNL